MIRTRQLEYPITTQNASAPRSIPFPGSNLVYEGLVDAEAPIPIYLYSVVPGVRNLTLLHVLGLWGADRATTDTVLATVRHAQAFLHDIGVAPVVLVIDQDEADIGPCVLFANNSGSESLDLWMQGHEPSAEVRLSLCHQIARTVEQLHAARIANLPLSTRVMTLERDNTVSLYPIGNLFDTTRGNVESVPDYSFEDACGDDLERLHRVFLEVLDLRSNEDCEHRVLRRVLERLATRSEAGGYQTVAELARDLGRVRANEPINWIHSSVVDRAMVRLSKKKLAVALGILVLATSTTLAFSVRQQNHLSQQNKDLLEDDREADIQEAYELLRSVEASAERYYSEGDISRSLHLLDLLQQQHLNLRHYEPEFARDAAKIVALGRLRILRDPAQSDMQFARALRDETILDVREADLWEWFLDEAGDYREVLVEASEEI
ncbi:MAG: hypothetical protein ACF8GE_04100 [Phycisphaerales bacterium JB043]